VGGAAVADTIFSCPTCPLGFLEKGKEQCTKKLVDARGQYAVEKEEGVKLYSGGRWASFHSFFFSFFLHFETQERNELRRSGGERR